MKLGIGTVQFGLNYGISNETGKTPPEEVAKILELADRSGIRILDTAPLYGDSERVLGQILPAVHQFDLVTKTPQFAKPVLTHGDAQHLKETFYQSLDRLNQTSVYALLMHRADDLIAENGHLLMEQMVDLKRQGLVKKIGVSIYTQEQSEAILAKYDIDLIQLPINVFDQRLLQTRYLSQLKQKGIEVHGRSVFLQGLLLMEHYQMSAYFDPIKPHLQAYFDSLKRKEVTKIEAALGFVLSIKEVDQAICGVNTCKQLNELIISCCTFINTHEFDQFSVNDPAIIDPSQWNLR